MVDLQLFKDFLNDNQGFNGYNGVRFTVVEEGYCECEVDLTRRSLNPQGVAHGSLLFTLCDCVTGVATASVGRSMLTQSADIHYIRPGTGSKLIAKSRLIKSGRTTGLCAADVFDEHGRLLATAQFEVFYTRELTLPERDENGNWISTGDTNWVV